MSTLLFCLQQKHNFYDRNRLVTPLRRRAALHKTDNNARNGSHRPGAFSQNSKLKNGFTVYAAFSGGRLTEPRCLNYSLLGSVW